MEMSSYEEEARDSGCSSQSVMRCHCQGMGGRARVSWMPVAPSGPAQAQRAQIS